MTALKRHVIAVVAALFALAVGIAIGGGPLSYVPEGDDSATTSPGDSGSDEPGDPDQEPAAPDPGSFADLFAATVATRLYDGQLLGHPTAILAMPGADPDVVEGMRTQVKAAGGGLTGVFEVGEGATDLAETNEVDAVGNQLVERLSEQYNDRRVDPTAPTYVRLGQLIGLAVGTPAKEGGRASKEAEDAVRSALAEAELLESPEGARLAPLVLVVLPAHGPDDDPDDDDLRVTASVYRGLVQGLSDNPVGLTLLGDTASGESGILEQLRSDEEVTVAASTVDGGDTGIGQVTAMLAVMRSLNASTGSYGASGSDGAVPLS